MKGTFFISGIGTDVGKSYATGWLARKLMEEGQTTATMKFIQTGNTGRSEDIEVHRKLMKIEQLPEDKELITSPIIFSYPASPDLASRLDGKSLELSKADDSIKLLSSRYDTLLIEGAGGLMVPLKGDYLTIDFIKERNLPVILVTNGKLGSVSDTLLSLFAIKNMGIDLTAVIYNAWFDKDKIIAEDTRAYLRTYLSKEFPNAEFIEMPDNF